MSEKPTTPADLFLADMLGQDLADAIFAARRRTGDDSVTVRIERSLCQVERGGEIFHGGLSHDTALQVLADLK